MSVLIDSPDWGRSWLRADSSPQFAECLTVVLTQSLFSAASWVRPLGRLPGTACFLCGSRVCGVGDYRLVGKVFCFPQYCVPSVLRPAAPRLWGGCCFKLGLCSPRHLSLDLEGSIARGMLNLGVVEILTGKARSSLYVLQPDARVHCTEVLSAGAEQHRI